MGFAGMYAKSGVVGAESEAGLMLINPVYDASGGGPDVRFPALSTGSLVYYMRPLTVHVL